MKKILLLSALFSLLVSCGNSDDDTNNDNGIVFKAMINGEQWSYEEIEESSLLNIEETNEQNLVVKGRSGNIKIALGMYDENSPPSNCIPLNEYNFISVSVLYKDENGTFTDSHSININDNINNLIVTKCEDGKISGSFSANLVGGISGVSPEQVEITNGVFTNIPFEVSNFQF